MLGRGYASINTALNSQLLTLAFYLLFKICNLQLICKML